MAGASQMPLRHAGSIPVRGFPQMLSHTRSSRHRGDSNPCGQSPMDFKSISLTARTQCHGKYQDPRRRFNHHLESFVDAGQWCNLHTGPPPGLQAVLLVSRPSILTTQILPDLSDAQKLHKYPSPPRNNVRTSHYLCLRSRKQYRMLHVCNAKHCDTAV